MDPSNACTNLLDVSDIGYNRLVPYTLARIFWTYYICHANISVYLSQLSDENPLEILLPQVLASLQSSMQLIHHLSCV